MKNQFVQIIILFCVSVYFSNPVYSQNKKYINENNAFKIEALTWDKGDAVIVCELHLQDDSTDFIDRDFEFGTLTVLIAINNSTKTIQVEPLGTGMKRTYRIDKNATGFTKVVENENWSKITYFLNYSLKTIGKKSEEHSVINKEFRDEAVSVLQAKTISNKVGDRKILIELICKSDGIRIIAEGTGLKKLSNDQSFIANLKTSTVINTGDSQKIELELDPGVSINRDDEYYLCIESVKDGRANPTYKQPFKITMYLPYYVTRVSNNAVFGNVSTELIAKTVTEGNSLRLIFKSNPLSVGEFSIITGIKSIDDPNEFKFIIPSDSKSFKYGSYQIVFAGENALGYPYEESSPRTDLFEKKRINSIEIQFEQNKDTINFSSKLDHPMNDKIYLYLNGKNIGEMNTTDSINFEKQFSNLDVGLRGNFVKDSTTFYLQVSINDELSAKNIKKVKAFDKETIIAELNKIEGNKNEKKEKIWVYLNDKGFNNATQELVDSILAEITKGDKKVDWNKIGSALVNAIPYVGGILKVFLG